MSARRVRQEGLGEEIQTGLERLWDNMVDKHLGEDKSTCLVQHFESIIMFAGTPAPSRTRPLSGLAVSALPHVAILCFTVLVVWTAQPSSSECRGCSSTRV